ncbi:Sucrase/ferredoxin-like-domain-containing protein [Thelephora terrestris]|uniref:Sucrase/ferredoxin-like-domain-containing protein n=1 Tax=Thelephora terrestris TaxID=56493 RepID=A0A9P6HJE5_9AGAM|nr:Sucrase/ferredoxin-like-domain-containing protein [Thelephora terrestris]
MRDLRCVRSLFRGFCTTTAVSDLAGTAPFHDYYVMLHSQNPPQEFPKVISSQVQKALQLALTSSNGLVNFSWSPQQRPPPLPSSLEEEVYSATAFSKAGNVIELDGLTLSNVQATVQRITSPGSAAQPSDSAHPLYIYVCTHAKRDCRCGETGGLVAEAFRQEIDRRNLTSVVKLGETGHVGGHKYAANVLIYPKGEWLGCVTPGDVSNILDKALESRALDWNPSTTPPPVPSHWRGRMGLGKEHQLALAAAHHS